jgi:hypothetical protein
MHPTLPANELDTNDQNVAAAPKMLSDLTGAQDHIGRLMCCPCKIGEFPTRSHIQASLDGADHLHRRTNNDESTSPKQTRCNQSG